VRAINDSERFQAWLQHIYEARQHETDTIAMGPFRAVMTAAENDATTAWVTLVDSDTNETEALRSLAKLRTAFAKHNVSVEVEYDSEAFPQASQWFQEAGFIQVEENPLMACRPETFVPAPAAHVSLTQLTQHAKPAELEAFQGIRWSNGGDYARKGPSIDDLRRDLKAPGSVYLLAWLDWEPVGTGVSLLTKDAAEVLGIVTRNDHRRLGVATAVTSELVRRHFERGGDFVFLDAANEPAARVYQRLGFARFGSKVVFK
jgi:ribosomal protein S18 acetylase RimI-like enzyme